MRVLPMHGRWLAANRNHGFLWSAATALGKAVPSAFVHERRLHSRHDRLSAVGRRRWPAPHDGGEIYRLIVTEAGMQLAGCREPDSIAGVAEIVAVR